MSEAKPVDYICFGCAALYGAGEVSEGCTMHEAHCDNCGTKTGLCSVDDWNWPNGKPAKWRGAGRD